MQQGQHQRSSWHCLCCGRWHQSCQRKGPQPMQQCQLPTQNQSHHPSYLRHTAKFPPVHIAKGLFIKFGAPPATLGMQFLPLSTAILLAKLSMLHQELLNCCQARIKHLHFCSNEGRSLAEQLSALGLLQVGVQVESAHWLINPDHLCQRNRVDAAVDLVGAASCPISQQSRDVERAAYDAVLHHVREVLSGRVRCQIGACPSSSEQRRVCTLCLPVIPPHL
jgi:hypothetical protein